MKSFAALLVLASGLANAEPVPLFDGKSLDGWKIQGADYWKVVDGVVTGQSDEKKKNSILWTKKDFTDFALDLEFRFSGHIDSGVFLRHMNEQIQIGISGSLKRDMTASPYIGSKRGYPVEAEGVKELLKEGEWNSMRIVAKGNHYAVTLNGKEVMNYDSDTARDKGPIGLQVHPGVEMKVEFRGLTLEELAE
ncbi:glycosylhydrolase [Haloferula helveola]|uniref:Glycosylhydrolase n=1 Tax=Haloferula helveola TaxID=490095 RepID=A0ABM7RIT0_9BACT|nr:glycosylhydrolase [Haloferula helveola]